MNAINRENFDPGPLADVAVHADGDNWVLVFVRDLRHPPEKVWLALTEPEQLRAWAPFTADRDLGRVGDATLTMTDRDTSQDFAATVIRAEPPTVLEYTWATDLLRWELAPTSTGTRLTLRHTVSDPDLLAKVSAGWHICLTVAECLLDGNPIGPIVGENAMNYGWNALHDAYAEKLGVAEPDGLKR
jgi:uncharacterized protein YndB with AHSA1/START domain